MNSILPFHPQLMVRLPETHRLLVAGGLSVHEAVAQVTLHGSRGLAGSPRPDSDIDLGLIVDDQFLRSAADPNALLNAVLSATRDSWRGSVELDLAAVFDRSGCGLGCLTDAAFDFANCPATTGCLGVYKLQRGFHGYVDPATVDCRKMRPCLTIWERNLDCEKPEYRGSDRSDEVEQGPI